MRVLVVDYGMGNLGSAGRAFELCGADVTISDDPRDLAAADRIVVPGVGSYGDGMANLTAGGWPEQLRVALANSRVRLLGICLGMQLLADRGTEGGVTPGLGLIPGEVIKLEPSSPDERIPHVGWNEVYPSVASGLLADVTPGTDFYFVHSFHFVPRNPEHVLATTPYCGGFVSAAVNGNVFGVQFHPEKSSTAGRRVIARFLEAGPSSC